MGSRVLAKACWGWMLDPSRAADAAAASCLGVDNLAGRRPFLGDRPLAHVWPWAHDPRLWAGPQGVGQPTVAARSLKCLGGASQRLAAPTFWSYWVEININFKRGYLASYVLGSWPKAGRPCVMDLPANCGN